MKILHFFYFFESLNPIWPHFSLAPLVIYTRIESSRPPLVPYIVKSLKSFLKKIIYESKHISFRLNSAFLGEKFRYQNELFFSVTSSWPLMVFGHKWRFVPIWKSKFYLLILDIIFAEFEKKFTFERIFYGLCILILILDCSWYTRPYHRAVQFSDVVRV